MDYAAYTTADFDHSPLMFYYETTTACDLVCKHCRASAQENPDPEQLSTEQSKQLLSQIAHVPQAADGRAHRRRSVEAARPDGTDRPRPQRRPGNGPHALRHAAGHARRPLRGSAKRASSGWASASTVPTPRSTTTSAAGKAASIGPARCSWPPANWAWPCRSTPRFAGGTSTCWTRWPSSSRPSASPCGPCSSSCRWAAASRKSGSSPRSMKWSSKSSTTGRRSSPMP